MAILNKIIPAIVDSENKVNLNFQLTYDTNEQPWTSVKIYFYNLNSELIYKSDSINYINNNGEIVFEISNINSIGLYSNTKYLVSIGKTDTDITTNSRVLLIMTSPIVSEINIEQEYKKISFTYTPTYEEETLDTYQFFIKDNTNDVICETSELIYNTKANGESLEYYYSSYLEAEHSYFFSVSTYSKSGLLVEKSTTIIIPAITKYEDNPILIPIKPNIINNEEYGYVKISMPKEIIKYCSNIELNDNIYTLTIPNCYGCDSSATRFIYTSLSLQNKIEFTNLTNSNVNDVTSWELQIPADRITLTETCCVGFMPKGKFKLVKETNLGEIETLTKIILPNDTDYIYEDYFVEQGYEYKYYLLPDYNNLTSGALSTATKPQWDGILLSDANGKILSIQYNPQISSFKTTILEQKQDTLGDKFPFFLRNGDVYYKEIPLSGLISYQSDPLNKFQVPVLNERINNIKENKIRRNNSNIKDYDEFYLERIYKTEVEKWLNNGEPKLLRTAAEGTFIVRLMNVSLSPMQQLGRRMHTFSATAYEIDDYNYNNLQKYGFNSINTQPSTSTSDSDVLVGTAVYEEQIISIKDIPTVEENNIYRVVINDKLNNKITKARFKNNNISGTNIVYISNILPNKSATISSGDNIECALSTNTFWFYILGPKNPGAQVELVYNSAKLE